MPGGVTVGDSGLCCCVPFFLCVASIVRAQSLPCVHSTSAGYSQSLPKFSVEFPTGRKQQNRSWLISRKLKFLDGLYIFATEGAIVYSGTVTPPPPLHFIAVLMEALQADPNNRRPGNTASLKEPINLSVADRPWCLLMYWWNIGNYKLLTLEKARVKNGIHSIAPCLKSGINSIVACVRSGIR